MRKVITTISFILLVFGTLGLLLDEFVFDWGKIITSLFAISNVIGLSAFIILVLSRKE